MNKIEQAKAIHEAEASIETVLVKLMNEIALHVRKVKVQMVWDDDISINPAINVDIKASPCYSLGRKLTSMTKGWPPG
jgi:hypothetical protein